MNKTLKSAEHWLNIAHRAIVPTTRSGTIDHGAFALLMAIEELFDYIKAAETLPSESSPQLADEFDVKTRTQGVKSDERAE